MEYYIENEHRQHIRLSRLAYQVMKTDSFNYRDAIPRLKTISGFINYIILNFGEYSEASIDIAVRTKREELEGNIIRGNELLKHSNKAVTSEQHTAIDSILEAYRYDLIQKMNDLDRRVTYKIKLDNKTYSLLYENLDNVSAFGDSIFNSQYYSRQGKYIAALMETYAHLSPCERESVIFRDNINFINELLSAGPGKCNKAIQIHYTSGNCTNNFLVKPYGIEVDLENRYHYLVGLSRKIPSDSQDYTIGLFRISKICGSIDIKEKYSGKIPEHDIKTIQKKIEECGVQFMIGSAEMIKIRLTKGGCLKYNSILHQRPQYIDVQELPETSAPYTHEYSFYCTRRQVTNYFFQFGKDALVTNNKLSINTSTSDHSSYVTVPTCSIHDELKHQYNDALKAYSQR